MSGAPLADTDGRRIRAATLPDKMRRKPNPAQRRRQLCDAAIRLLADGGVIGVTHRKVDRKAGVPDGTTSFYFRTRSALLHGIAARVAELDLKELTAATLPAPQSNADRTNHPVRPSGLATLVMRSATGTRLIRTKARHELGLHAARDPVLEEALRGYTERFFTLIREAVMQSQPGGRESEPAVVNQQTYVVMMFISGVMLALSSGDRRIQTPEELDVLISGIVAGIGDIGPTNVSRFEAEPAHANSRRRSSSSLAAVPRSRPRNRA